jgi:hypothetical protein
MIAKADTVRVPEWMGHADIQTTRRYVHCRPQHDDAALVAEAFAVAPRCADGGLADLRPDHGFAMILDRCPHRHRDARLGSPQRALRRWESVAMGVPAGSLRSG